MISNGATSTTTTAAAAASSSSNTAAASSSNTAAQSLGLKNFFKTPEGRYKLLHDKTHPSSLLPYALAKSITQSDSVEAVSRKGILMEMVMIKDMVMVVILAESKSDGGNVAKLFVGSVPKTATQDDCSPK
ncbi:uncharacterized protein LOC110889230 [Helianthus annuus]|uniref:uncharacterized protein LOC110889230 n=1 Tax=Helianthus annuus TaxID=4232 RepID=UPI000B8F575F|nr:uncharacterized protein LOC110889230 [Helianthus annuus]